MVVVAEIIRQELEDVAIAPIRDAASVARMIAAGVGNHVKLALGGKTDMPSIGLSGEPLEVEGLVRAITDGEFTITGPMYTGIRTFLGRTAVLDTGRAQIVVTERAHEPMDLGVFTHCGIDPRRKCFVMLKSRIHYPELFRSHGIDPAYCKIVVVKSPNGFRSAYQPIARALMVVDTPGVSTAKLDTLPFKRVPRPIYPLDPL